MINMTSPQVYYVMIWDEGDDKHDLPPGIFGLFLQICTSCLCGTCKHVVIFW